MKFTRLLLSSILAFGFSLLGGCTINPQTGQTIINDADATLAASLATTSYIALGVPAAEQAPAAQAVYEVASAVNIAAKNGISLSEIDTLAQTYLHESNPGYSAIIGDVILLIESGAQPSVANGAPPSTQPSTGDVQELLIDVSQGAMNGCLVYTGATPTAETMGLEQRGESSIVVRHFRWIPK